MSATRDGRASRLHRALLREHGYCNDPGPVFAAAAAQAVRCAAGEHDEAVAKRNHVTYLGMGVRVEPGTRYCRFCRTILPSREGGDLK